jgi:hypothetical protein
MFWKTKKDRIIEEQQERIEQLERELLFLTYPRPRVIEQNGKTITLCAKQLLDRGLPAEEAKSMIAHKMGDLLKDNIHFILRDQEPFMDKYVLVGYLSVVDRGYEDIN